MFLAGVRGRTTSRDLRVTRAVLWQLAEHDLVDRRNLADHAPVRGTAAHGGPGCRQRSPAPPEPPAENLVQVGCSLRPAHPFAILRPTDLPPVAAQGPGSDPPPCSLRAPLGPGEAGRALAPRGRPEAGEARRRPEPSRRRPPAPGLVALLSGGEHHVGPHPPAGGKGGRVSRLQTSLSRQWLVPRADLELRKIENSLVT